MDLEWYRKEAKRLTRAFAEDDERARTRGAAVGVPRHAGRLSLGDAQHVVAVEHGFRSWRELRARALAGAGAPEPVEAGLEYVPGAPVRLGVSVRRFPYVDDGGEAVERSGRPDGWYGVALEVAREHEVNVNRAGVLSLPVVPRGPGRAEIVRRVAAASQALHAALLEARDEPSLRPRSRTRAARR